jgi:hypothetical protein
MRKQIFVILHAAVCSVLIGCSDVPPNTGELENGGKVMGENAVIGLIQNTELAIPGEVFIKGVGKFNFDPGEVRPLRKDIFRSGHFSVFDVLAHLDMGGEIDMKYHFNERMNTYVIDAINGQKNWWYKAYYHGGWSENNNFRMDHFPYKDRMYIMLFRSGKKSLNTMYTVFREEVGRRRENGGKVIIPEVIIRTPGVTISLTNVEVQPHNLRRDIFQDGVVTAIDVVMTLGDLGKLTYDLKWHDTIGTSIVRNFFVERINEYVSYARCGFVYESGSYRFRGFRGNHIHLPSDTRALNSPEYLEYFWICI